MNLQFHLKLKVALIAKGKKDPGLELMQSSKDRGDGDFWIY